MAFGVRHARCRESGLVQHLFCGRDFMIEIGPIAAV